ncbi:uncharacterized protein LOC135475165 isoform X2 [Liolophura sinensis]
MKGKVSRRSVSPEKWNPVRGLESVIHVSSTETVKAKGKHTRNHSKLPLGMRLSESVIKMTRKQSYASPVKSCIVENKCAEKASVSNSCRSPDLHLSKGVPLQTSIQDFPTWHRKGKPTRGHESEKSGFSQTYEDSQQVEDQPLDLSSKPKKRKAKCEPKVPCSKKVSSLEATDLSSSLQSLQQKFGGDFPFQTSRRPRIGLTEQYYMSHLHVSTSSFSNWRKSSSRGGQHQEYRQADHADIKNGHCDEQAHSSESTVKGDNTARNSQTVNAILTKISGSSDTDKQDSCANKHTTHRCSCQKTFHTLYELSIHLQESGHSPGVGKQTSLMEYPKLVRGQDMWLNQGSEQTKQILRCIQCGESFKSLPELTVHMMETQHYTKIVSTEHGRRAHKCSAYCERESTDSDCVFKCKICHKVFSDMEALANHMVISGHHRKQSVRSCGDSLTEASVNKQYRKRLLDDSSVVLNKAAHLESKRTLLMPSLCAGDLHRDSSRARSPANKVLRTVHPSDKKIACENCGNKIEMEMFVEHIRYCLRKRVEEIHHLRLSELPSPCEDDGKARGNDSLLLKKAKWGLKQKDSERMRLYVAGDRHISQRKLNSSHCLNSSSNGEVTHSHKTNTKALSSNHVTASPNLSAENNSKVKCQSAPSSPCNSVRSDYVCSSRFPVSSKHVMEAVSRDKLSKSPNLELSPKPLLSHCRESQSSHGSDPRCSPDPGINSPREERNGECKLSEDTTYHPPVIQAVDTVDSSSLDQDRRSVSPPSGGFRSGSPPLAGIRSSPPPPAGSSSRSQSPGSSEGLICPRIMVNGFVSDLSQSPSPDRCYSSTPDKKSSTDPAEPTAQELNLPTNVKVEDEKDSDDESSIKESKSKSYEERSPSAIEQMILEYSSNSMQESVSHLKKLTEIKLPLRDNHGRGLQKSGHSLHDNHGGEKNKECGNLSKPLDIIDPDSSDSIAPAINALKAMENLIQKSFESKSDKTPKKLCPIDMLRQPLYGWFYQRDMYKAYPSSQGLKKDIGHVGVNQREKPKLSDDSKPAAGNQTNGVHKTDDINMETRSPEVKVSSSSEETPVKRESVVCKYLNFFDETSSENGKKSKGSALDSLSSFVYGQPLTSEHPLDSLQRLISKADTPLDSLAGGRGSYKHPASTPEPSGGGCSSDGDDLPLNLTVKCQAVKSEEHCPSSSHQLEADPKSEDSPSGNSDGEFMEYKCPACNRHFATKGSYRYHLSRCHLSTVKKYGISTAFHMSPYIYLPLDHTAKFTKYYEMAQELAGKELTEEQQDK